MSAGEAFSEYTYVQVEPNDSCPMSASQVYKNGGAPFRVASVQIYDGEPEGKPCAVTGWGSEGGGSAVEAFAVLVEDSSEGAAYLVYGGDWGIRLRPADSEAAWSLDDPAQFGETHLVLADLEDLTPA